MIKHAVVLLMVAMTVASAAAQPTDLERSRLNLAAFYNYTEPGDVAITVHVWGAVRFAGLYEIPRGTSLTELVSLAGGPQFGERNRRANRYVDIKLHRSDGINRSVVYQAVMENQIVVASDAPVLQTEDVLTFEATIRQGFRWRDLFPIVSMIGTMVLIIDRISTS